MLGIFLYIGGIICIALANIISIILGIYYWGGAGMDLGPAAWEAAKIWIVMMVAGGLTMALGASLCVKLK